MLASADPITAWLELLIRRGSASLSKLPFPFHIRWLEVQTQITTIHHDLSFLLAFLIGLLVIFWQLGILKLLLEPVPSRAPRIST